MELVDRVGAGENAPNLQMIDVHHRLRVGKQHTDQGGVIDEIPLVFGLLGEGGDSASWKGLAQIAAEGVE